jgi:hypothetical protein
MLNRNNIFKTVRDTENTLNVSTGRKMDNFYTELLQYENTAQRRYDKIKNILESIRYHHNKIQNINKKYSNAIYGGSDDSDKLLKAIELAIDNIEILETSLKESQFNTLIIKNHKALINKIGKSYDNNTKKIQDFNIKEEDITENSIEFFEAAKEELTGLKKVLESNDTNISNILKNIIDFEPLLMKYINENKLVNEYRESILKGFKDIKGEISENKKENLANFTSYSENIKQGLVFAKANKNSVKSVDKQILTAFLSDSNKVVFKTTDRMLEINKKKTDISFEVDTIEINVKNRKKKAKILNSDLDLEFIIDKDDTSPTGKLTINSFLEIIISDKYTSDGKIKSCRNALSKFFKEEVKEEVIDVEKFLTKIREQKLRYIEYDYDSNNANHVKTQEFFKKKEEEEKEDQQKKEEEDQHKKGGDSELNKKDSVVKLQEILTNIKSRILNNIGNNSDKKDKDKDKDKDNTTTNTNTNTNQPNAITNSIISSIIKNYEKERKNINSIDQKIKLDAKFVDYLDNLGLNLADIFKINLNDKFAFIFFILILHISVYSIIESLIMNDYISGIVYIMAAYVGVYIVIMLVLILILNKYVNYRIKATLNYLNTDFNIYLITMHLFIVFMFYIVVLLLSQHIDIFVAKDEDDKLQILYRIEVISSIIFIFSSVFIMLL